MSSILRALKKIESDSAKSSGIQSGPGTSSVAMVRGKSFVYKGILAAGIVISLGISAALMIKEQLKSTSGVSTTAEVSPGVDLQRQPDQAYLKTQAEPKKKTHIPPVVNENISMLKAHDSNMQDEVAIEVNPTDSSLLADGPPEDASLQKIRNIPDAAEPDQTKPSLQHSPAQENWAGVGELDRSAGLDLQAISWATDPNLRLAVINGSLCRENESINGYTVKQINPDDVIVFNGSVSGKLILKIR